MPYRVLLLRTNPPGLAFRPPGPPPAAPPNGLLILAASLRRLPDVEVVVRSLSADVRDLEDVRPLVWELAPDLVGLSALTLDESRALACARLARQAKRDVRVVIGGPLATLTPRRCMDEPDVDGAVIGEGDHTLVELVEALGRSADPAGIPGLWWRSGGTLRKGRRRPFVADLDALPLPAWDLVDLQRYSKLFSFHDVPPVAPPYAPIVTSRGCPWRCAYCHNLFGRKPRLHGPGRVVDEMELLAREHGVGEIHIVDDVFNVDAERVMRICDEIERRGLDLKIAFPNGLRGDVLTPEQLRRLADVGCYSITFALETASPRLQKLIRKNLKVERVLANARLARDMGLITSGYVMLGFPTETREEMEATVRAVTDSAFDLPRIFTVCPFPGTELYDLAVEHGFEPAAAGDEFDYEKLAVNASDLPDDEMREVLRDAHRRIGDHGPRRDRLRRIRDEHPHPGDPVFQRSFWTSLDRGRRATSRQTDVLLVFPPAGVAFEVPELGMPTLAGHLRGRGLRVEQRDLNVEAAFHRFTGPEYVAAMLRQPGWTETLLGPDAARGDAPSDARLEALISTRAARRELYRFVEGDLEFRPPELDLDSVVQWSRGHANEPLRALCRDALSDVLRPIPPRVAGLSVASAAQLGPALHVARFLRDRGCEFVALGGPWARTAAPLVARWPELFDVADGIVVGEGEQSLEQLVDAIRQGRDPAGLAGLAVRRGGEVVAGPAVDPIPLSELATPDFAGLDLDRYPRRCLPLRTRRACPWGQCTFCHHIAPGGTRDEPALPAEEVVRRMAALRDAHGVREFDLANLATPLPELLEVAAEIRARGLDVRWSSLARVEPGYDGGALQTLSDAGCGELGMGLESVAARDLARARKGIGVDRLRGILDAARGKDAGISLFVLNLPDQRLEDFEATLKFCAERADGLRELTIGRFALSSGSPVFGQPHIHGITLGPAAHRHLDVFDLPFDADWPVDDRTYAKLAVQHRLEFARRREPLSLWSIRDAAAAVGVRQELEPSQAMVTHGTLRELIADPLRAIGHLAALRTESLIVDGVEAAPADVLKLARYSKVVEPSRRVYVIAAGGSSWHSTRHPYVDGVLAVGQAFPGMR
jgi:anaerobic magnesium-protoporphyrin IX monomethyl ester cyclase